MRPRQRRRPRVSRPGATGAKRNRRMKVLVTFAVEAEFAPWRRRRDFRRAVLPAHPVYGEKSVYEGQMGNCTVRVLLTGMGWENAGWAVHAALDQDVPDACISSGLAGGLSPAYRPGEILAARKVSEADGAGVMHSDPALLKTASDHGARVVDSFLTSRRLVVQAEEKQRMGRFGDAAEMESFPVLAAACSRSVPSIAIRAIADAADEDLPLDFGRALTPQGQVSIARALQQLARRPRALPALGPFVQQCRRAAHSLAEFLDVYVGSLPALMDAYAMESPAAAT